MDKSHTFCVFIESLTFVHPKVYHVIRKAGEFMSAKMGRPTDNPKNLQFKIRLTQQEMDDLNYCCEQLNETKSNIIRLGIQKVKAEIEK